jgi:AcrR family transcriptional regulator
MKNKEVTKRKLLDAVGSIIKTKGFGGLGVNKVAKAAGVSKILIYRYFGTYNQLIITYVREKDFWVNYSSGHQQENDCDLSVLEHITLLLKNEFNHFYDHCELEAALLKELANNNTLLKDISNNSTLHSRTLQPAKGQNKSDHTTYFYIISALLIAGTHQLFLQKQADEGTPQQIVALEPKSQLLQSIAQIVHWTFG